MCKNKKLYIIVTFVLYFGQPKKGPPRFFGLFEILRVTFKLQLHIESRIEVRLKNDDEEIDDDILIREIN